MLAADQLERIDRIPFSGCWVWMGFVDRDGYGRVGHSAAAYRAFYEHFRGPIPEGLVLDHLCRVRCCVNPHHLEPVTRAENNARSAPANKKHCAKGHLFDETNTGTRTSGSRYCITCQRTANRASYRKRVDAGITPVA